MQLGGLEHGVKANELELEAAREAAPTAHAGRCIERADSGAAVARLLESMDAEMSCLEGHQQMLEDRIRQLKAQM